LPYTLVAFSSAAQAVKVVADVGRNLPQPSQERLAKLPQTELYEEDKLVNGYHDPLRNGDVFEIGEGEGVKLWVLIAQPCDLMVRPDGERAREDSFRVAVLAPMQNAVPEGDAPRAGLGFVLDHFGKHGAQNAFVDFRDATPVNLRVLDLVVLSKSGKWEIGPESELDPNMLLPARAWSSRAKVLPRHFGKVTVEVEKARTKF